MPANLFEAQEIDGEEDTPEKRLNRSRLTINKIGRILTKIDAVDKRMHRLKTGGKAWKEAGRQAAVQRVQVARTLRDLRMVSAQIDYLQ